MTNYVKRATNTGGFFTTELKTALTWPGVKQLKVHCWRLFFCDFSTSESAERGITNRKTDFLYCSTVLAIGGYGNCSLFH